jgi:hypothetical protein
MKRSLAKAAPGTSCHKKTPAPKNLGDILHGRWTPTAGFTAAFWREIMTKTAKLATAAGVALLVSFTLMGLFHAYGPHPSFMSQPGFNGAHPMTAMWTEMGWLMALGPMAMILFFGGILTLVVLLVRSLAKPG